MTEAAESESEIEIIVVMLMQRLGHVLDMGPHLCFGFIRLSILYSFKDALVVFNCTL